jgi:hypothetical protein
MERKLTTKPLLGKLVKWTVWAAFAFSLSVIALYCIGSYRDFSDTTQFFLVRLCIRSSIFLVLASLYGIALAMWYAVRYKNGRYCLGIPGFLLLVLFGSASAAGAAFILSLAGGNL